MINEFWNLVVETWEQGIRGVGVDDIIICLVIVIASLLARSLMNSYVLDKVAKFTERSETTLDDEIIESLRFSKHFSPTLNKHQVTKWRN